jgi:hypothetical protein
MLQSFNLYCISQGMVDRTISICSDSRAVLLAPKSYTVSSRTVLQCGDSLQELVLSYRVRLLWVPGHCGIHGEEEADGLASMGSNSLLWGWSLVFRWHFRVSSGGSENGYLNHTAFHGAWRLLVVSRECG